MSCLFDLNVVFACAWGPHHRHADAIAGLVTQNHFATCPVSQLGFIRVSMSPGYRASFSNAQTALAAITTMGSAEFLPDTIAATTLPALSHHAEMTDAYWPEHSYQTPSHLRGSLVRRESRGFRSVFTVVVISFYL